MDDAVCGGVDDGGTRHTVDARLDVVPPVVAPHGITRLRHVTPVEDVLVSRGRVVGVLGVAGGPEVLWAEHDAPAEGLLAELGLAAAVLQHLRRAAVDHFQFSVEKSGWCWGTLYTSQLPIIGAWNFP